MSQAGGRPQLSASFTAVTRYTRHTVCNHGYFEPQIPHKPHLENNPRPEGRNCAGGDDEDASRSAAGVSAAGASSAQARTCCRTWRPLLRPREDSLETPTGMQRNAIAKFKTERERGLVVRT